MMNQKATLLIILLLLASVTLSNVDDAPRLLFDTKDLGDSSLKAAPKIEPWRVVKLDPTHGGLWVVAGDIDSDGQVEIVSSKNHNENDVHYTTTAVAQELDGTVLWRWGDPDIGRKIWHHDVACQIHDWDNDGNKEVVVLAKGAIVELDGSTGKERRRIEIAEDATDCIVFCNLTGGKQASDILVKNRYHQIWAYDYKGELLWTVKDPGGYRTAHKPRAMDLDNDGRDEVMAGYAMLNSDGSVRWVFKSEKVDQGRGHLDCVRVARRGKKPEDFRLALTCCGANNVAMIDGNGKVLWEHSGHHFESINTGPIIDGRGDAQILVDIDHQPYGKSPIWILDEEGNRLGQFTTDYSRHHALLDWTGDGLNEIFVGHNRAIYNQQGKRIATLHTPGAPKQNPKGRGQTSVLIGDMTGDSIPDVILARPDTIYIFENKEGAKSAKPIPLGTERNFTLY